MQFCSSRTIATAGFADTSPNGWMQSNVPGRCAILLRPEPVNSVDGDCVTFVARTDTGFQDEFPNLRFCMPDEQASLLSAIRACGVREIDVHSLIGHSDSVVDLILHLASARGSGHSRL